MLAPAADDASARSDRAGPPAPLRVVAAALAAGVGVLFLALEAPAWLSQGCGATALANVAAALPLVGFLGLFAAAPQRLAAPLARRTRVDLSDAGHGAALIVLAGTLFFVLGLGGLVSAVATLEGAIVPTCRLAGATTSPGSGDDIFRAVTLNLAIFTLPVLFYVSYVHARGPRGTLQELGLRPAHAASAALTGAVAALVFVLLLFLVEAAASRVLPASYLENQRALDIARSLTPLGAVVLAVISSVGEEVFFRGFLQPRVGLFATASLFALAHVSYASVSEVVVVFALAFALGFLYKRTGNLAAPVAMHFLFNAVNLLLAVNAT